MTKWDFTITSKVKLKKPVLISGLPGIGNVGKVAVDFLVESMGAKPYAQCFSLAFPNTVFVGEDNLIEMPKIELFHKKHGSTDLLFLVGDMQPIDERSNYSFCLSLLDLLGVHSAEFLVTLGGIGLKEVPKKPKIFMTGNDKSFVKQVAKLTKADPKIYGVVGPIVGVSGLLVALAERKGIKAVTLLVETFNHPLYLGMKEARLLVEAIVRLFKLKVKISEMDKEIEEVEREVLKKTQGIAQLQHKKSEPQVNYIG